VLLDSRAEENFILYMFVKQSGLLFTGEGPRIVKPFNNSRNAYQLVAFYSKKFTTAELNYRTLD
jgi:hypothetical protein